MKTRKKIVSIILSLAMVISLMPMALAAGSGYQDTDGHWAETAIDRWSGYGILEGDSGNFNPDGALTRAQMAAILSRLLNLPDAPDAGFSDVKPDDWFAEYINKCAAAGIMLGDNGKANPNEPITRQQAIVMIARALGIQPIENPDLTKYADAAQVSAYAQGYVAALIEAGIVGGVTADLLAPQANINRASTVTIFDRAIGTYANEAGQTIKADGDGLILIVAKDVKLTDVPEGTRIVVADGATGLTVNGKAVSDDQTYIVPETTTDTPSGGSSSGGSSSGGGHSHRYTYTDNGDGTHTGTCYADDSTRGPEDHIYISGTCIVCGAEAEGKTASVKNSDNVVSYYDTLSAAIENANDGDTVYLLADLSSGNVWLKDGVTLNLGGHTIDANGGYGLLAANGIEVTVKNGTITNAYSSLVVFGTEEKKTPTVVTVDSDVTIENSSYGIIFSGYHETYAFTGYTGFATLNFNGTINAGKDQCAIFVMGNLGNDSTSATAIGEDGNQINIGASAKITAQEVAIILNGMAKLTVVDGATIEGADAITMKRGYLDITGGTFKGTGEKHTPTDAEHSGAESSGSAITVSSTYNYSGVIDVKISGGTFTSDSSYGFYAGQSVEGDKQIAFKNTNFAISGGTFAGGNGGVFFATGKHITGGTFSSDPSKYVASGYTATQNDADMWEVACIFAGGSGTEEDPFLITSEAEWLALADQARSSSGTTGQYYVVDKDLDFTGVTQKAGFRYFAGNIDFQGHTISGLNGSNTYTFRYPSLFKYVYAGATIKNLEYELPNLGTDNTVKPIGAIEGTGTVTLENIAISGNLNMTDNNTGLLVDFIGGQYDYTSKFVGTVNLIGCTSTCNMVNNGFSSVFIGGIYKGGNQIVLNAKDCVNYGKILSTGQQASMLISNPTCYSGDSLTLNIENCRNEGKIIAAPGKSYYLAMPDAGSELKFYTAEEIKAFETSGAIVNANGGITASLNAGELTVTDGKFDLTTAMAKAPDATRFVLAFGFQGTGGLGAGGVTQYAFTFDSRDAVENVSANSWVNASEATGALTAHNEYGTTYYTDEAEKYVYNQAGYIMNNPPEVSFIAYGEDGNVMLVDFYTYTD